jgi:ribonuclease HII
VITANYDLTYELQHGRTRGLRVAGIDEVGRGPLAGPVVACAVILPAELSGLPPGITDSKKLTEKKRTTLAPILRAVCAFGLGQASVAEIDELNILQATFLAMRRALAALGGADFALIDGPYIPKNLGCPANAVVEGDAKVLSIAAASIIAKVERDALMARLAVEHPGYGWESNAGYGSAGHLTALGSLGVTQHHRRSFAPVAAILRKESVQA